MKEKMICSIIIILLQIIEIIYANKKYNNKKFDILHITYQIILFIIFQILIWIIV